MTGADMPAKGQVTKEARDMAVACFVEDGAPVRRPTGSNAVLELDEVFLCFNVQHAKWKTPNELRFCVNLGVLPREMSDENWTGYLGKYPQTVDCVFRSRLKPRLDQSDWWWTVTGAGTLRRTLESVDRAARLVKTGVLPDVGTAAGCLTHQNIANPNRPSPVLQTLTDWRARYA